LIETDSRSILISKLGNVHLQLASNRAAAGARAHCASVVKTTNTTKLILWRDSVCAGDDCDAPHELALAVGADSLGSFIKRLLAADYLPSISGGNATWILKTERHTDRALAVIAQQWAEPRFVVAADAAEQDLHLVKETHYQHKTHIDKAAGVFDLDCSGFVDHLLKQVAPQQYDRLPIEPGHTRPRAEVYYQFFVELAQTPKPGWKAVSRFAELRRGDLIAWKKETAAQETGDTGHVMVVGAAPTRLGNGSYRLTIYDSTKGPHDNDTRAPGADGIGRGDLFFSRQAFRRARRLLKAGLSPS
jgi:hypothetical protein